MHRSTIVYIAMLGISGLVLWAVLAIGRHLVPPENLNGVWTPTPGNTGPGVMHVEQSGHFFQITFDDGHRADVKLQSQIAEGDKVTMKLVGGPWHFDVSGRLAGNAVHWVVDGPTTADWMAGRPDDHAAAAGKVGAK